jgi:hypothetical protein
MTTTTTTVPLAPAGTSGTSKRSSPVSPPAESSRSSVPAGPPSSVAPKEQATPTPPRTRPPSRPRSATAVSQETSGREHLRRKSATPAIKLPGPEHTASRPSTATATTAAGRRSKRPAPGPVTSGQDGGAAVSVGRRKAKPAARKRKDSVYKESAQALRAEDVRIDEDGVAEEIDPNEPRYCLCGDVSFGTMICCEDTEVSCHQRTLLLCDWTILPIFL